MTGVDRHTVYMIILVPTGGRLPLVSDFDTGLTFERTFLDGGWIYIVGGTIGYLVFFVVHS